VLSITVVFFVVFLTKVHIVSTQLVGNFFLFIKSELILELMLTHLSC